MKRPSFVLFGLVAIGCGEDSMVASGDEDGIQDGADYTDEMPDDLPAGECRDSQGVDVGDCEGAESSGGVDAAPAADGAQECASSEACAGAGACVAIYDDGTRGTFSCRFACVPTLDESTWCSDDASCCDDDARCTSRGYCVVAPTPERTGPAQESEPTFSDEMPDDLPAGGDLPTTDVRGPR